MFLNTNLVSGMSKTFMAMPTLVLYSISILIARRIEKRRAQRQAAEEAEEAGQREGDES